MGIFEFIGEMVGSLASSGQAFNSALWFDKDGHISWKKVLFVIALVAVLVLVIHYSFKGPS
ncbi:MAG: hypothetical protein HY053_09725 [Proteobacteria bacterium]|nr:hypothetical protein [Pseudomonadota bacterium]